MVNSTKDLSNIDYVYISDDRRSTSDYYIYAGANLVILKRKNNVW